MHFPISFLSITIYLYVIWFDDPESKNHRRLRVLPKAMSVEVAKEEVVILLKA